MPESRYTPDEIADRAHEIYEHDIRARVEPESLGKFLVVDIESGDYEIDEDELAATLRSELKHPDGVRFLIRIGSDTAYTVGWFPWRDHS